MTYTKQNLPTHLLTPPVRPANPLAEEFWDRNWTIFAIASQWGEDKHGMLTAIARWIHQVAPADKPLSRQRIQFIIHRVAWEVRDYSNAELGLEESAEIAA